MAFITKTWKPALIGVLLLFNYFAVKNFLLLSADLIRGDASADHLSPHPIIPLLRIPEGSAAEAHQAVHRIGSDFAQVYFPAQDISQLENAYNPAKTLDPWKRPSRYAPLVILACAATFCKLDFGYACFVEMLFQTLLFYGILYWAFSTLRIRKYFLLSLLLVNLCLFLTPAGLSWFERGQFSLYLAACYAVLMLGLLRRSPGLIIASAMLAFIKWTSFPAIFVILAAYLVGSRSLRELKANGLMVVIFALTTIVLLSLPALFTNGTDMFARGLMAQELEGTPRGISLLRYAPRLAVKLMPIAVIVLGYVNVRGTSANSDWIIPYSTGIVAIMLTYPTRAYEYGLASILGFAPALVFWTIRTGSRHNIPRILVLFASLLFVVAVSFSTRIFPALYIVVEVYLAFSVMLMLVPLPLSLWDRFQGRSSENMQLQ